MNKKILIVDYKTGNINSIVSAISHLGYDPMFSSELKDLDKAKKIILPGQGSYDVSMNNLKKTNLYPKLLEKIEKEKIFVLGICVGMHILSTFGHETSGTKKIDGLNLIKGDVIKLDNHPEKIPHIGWTTVEIKDKSDPIFKKIDNKKDFYFIHSYKFACKYKNNILANSHYNNEFNCIVRNDNVYGFQFHPEKSLKNGLLILKNFLELK